MIFISELFQSLFVTIIQDKEVVSNFHTYTFNCTEAFNCLLNFDAFFSEFKRNITSNYYCCFSYYLFNKFSADDCML